MNKSAARFLVLLLCLVIILPVVGQNTVHGDGYQFIGSKNSEVYHYPSCRSAEKILEKNKVFFSSAEEAVADGRHPCSICSPPTVNGVAVAAPTNTPTPTPISIPTQISVSINGANVAMPDMAPFIENGRTYVPVRAVLEAYGVDTIGYEAPNVLVSRGTDKLRIPVGQCVVIKNEISMPTDAAALIRNGRTCLPIRAVIEALGGTVGWNATTRTVLITKPAEKISAAPMVTPSTLKISFIDVGQGDAVF